jgi:hypothetical protein
MCWFFTNRIVQKRYWCLEIARKSAALAAERAAAGASISEIPTLTGGCDANSCGATAGGTAAPSHRNLEHEGDTTIGWLFAPGDNAFLADDFQ